VELQPVRVNGVGHPWAGTSSGVLHQFILEAVAQFSLTQFADLSLPLLTLQVFQFQPAKHSTSLCTLSGFVYN
jgi:hypothetical protein